MTREFGDRSQRISSWRSGRASAPAVTRSARELIDAFRADGATAEQLARWFSRTASGSLRLDLWTANRDQLLAAGVPADRIFTAGLCTQTNAHIFDSYRADGATRRPDGRDHFVAACTAGQLDAGSRPDSRA